jgi:hypothetical protein
MHQRGCDCDFCGPNDEDDDDEAPECRACRKEDCTCNSDFMDELDRPFPEEYD